MNQVVTIPERKSITETVANKYGMERKNFETVLKETVLPSKCSDAELAAFLIVANEYGLNPLTKEIYAFPARGGGIQPIVSVDGWCNLINSHPQANGYEFKCEDGANGLPVSVTCIMWRKDRSMPVSVTEYFEECKKPTEPWKSHPRRMLRHKALIQAARYAFGFSGIVDPDEAEGFTQAPTPQPPRVMAPPPPNVADSLPAPAAAIVEAHADTQEAVIWDDDGVIVEPSAPAKAAPVSDDDVLKEIDALLSVATADTIEDIWFNKCDPMIHGLFPPDVEAANALYRKHEKRVQP